MRHGYDIIETIESKFTDKDYGHVHRYISNGSDVELCLEDEVFAEFEKNGIETYSYETDHYDGGPGYEATVIFFAWIDNGKLYTSSVKTECM